MRFQGACMHVMKIILPCRILSLAVGNSESYLSYNFITNNVTCSLHAVCFSRLKQLDVCRVQYTTDPSFANLSLPVWGPINSTFTLPLQNRLRETVNYYHQVTVTIDESLEVVLRSSHRVEGCIESVTPANVRFQACMHAVTILY